MASLDPLGWTEATQVVAGNEADDPLYGPAIEPVRSTLNQEGVLYIGDCKMAAIGTRAGIQDANDYDLMPLPATIITPQVLDRYLNAVDQRKIEPIYRFDGDADEIAKGFEIIETVTGPIDGKTISWNERRLVIRSISYAKAPEKSLNKRLAKTAIAALTRALEFIQMSNYFGIILASRERHS